jgi:hypothetical protein
MPLYLSNSQQQQQLTLMPSDCHFPLAQIVLCMPQYLCNSRLECTQLAFHVQTLFPNIISRALGVIVLSELLAQRSMRRYHCMDEKAMQA